MPTVIVPYRAGCPHREAVWEWVQDRYASEHPGWPVIVGTPPDGPWCKALAITDALRQTDDDRLVIADADVWVDNLTEAVEALDDHPVVVPHRLLKRLDRATTERLLAGRPGSHTYDRPPYIGRKGGGITVLRRTTWDECPMDPRFVGWGQEDDSWALALECLFGRIHRLSADMLHLWHPPQPRKNRSTGSTEGRMLQRRYENADADTMRALLAEFTMEEAAT